MESAVNREDAWMCGGDVELSGLALSHQVVDISVDGECVDYGGISVINLNHQEVALINGEGCGKYSVGKRFSEVQYHCGGFDARRDSCNDNAGE